MARGKGVTLQRSPRGLGDARVITLATGVTWTDAAGKVRTVAGKDLQGWVGKRADRGHLPPRGFPKSNRFSE